MAVKPFSFSSPPAIHFGPHVSEKLGGIVSGFGKRALFVRGKNSLERSGAYAAVTASFRSADIEFFEWEIAGEPSPADVDGAVSKYKDGGITAVASVGGGSVIDAGKAISAMLPVEGSVIEYLEDVGTRIHPGKKVPFIAVPTTSGTGCEATKNAVISNVGPQGFKKSLRHDNFIPDAAIVDPVLTLSCPAAVTAACGLDTLSQLLESFVSTKASPLTDSLAQTGLEHVKDSLVPACAGSSQDVNVRADLSFAALLSGMTLANAGLCVVHGFASSIGGMFAIPHGVVCGCLLVPCMRHTIRALSQSEAGLPHLAKFARAGKILSGKKRATARETCDLLIETLEEYVRVLKIPRLGVYGVTSPSAEAIVDKTDNKNNPAKLGKDDLKKIVMESM